MPYFSAQPTSSLSRSIRNLVGGARGGQIDPLSQIAIEKAAAQTAHSMALTTKIREQVEAARRAEAARENPELAAEYAAHAAGLELASGTRLSNHLRGVLEQPSGADYEDNPGVQPYPTEAPVGVTPGARRIFQGALASTIANRIATGKTNAQQMTATGGNLQDNQLQEEALAPGTSLDRQNRIVAAIKGSQYMPFRTNSSGTVLNQATGALDEGSQLAARVRALAGARAGQASAAAGASNARRNYISGPQTDLTRARDDRVRSGQPATPVAPERVQRMIDMTALGEYKAAKAAYDALTISQRQKTTAPTLAGIREQVAARYALPGVQAEIADANDAIARGKDPAAVRARFKQRRGFDLPEVKASSVTAVPDEDDDDGG